MSMEEGARDNKARMNENSDEEDDEWWNDEVSIAPPIRAAATDRLTQWPTVSQPSNTRPANGLNSQARDKKATRRYSVNKPSRKESKQRQKRQNAKAGIKVFTNFSKQQNPPHVSSQATDRTHGTSQPAMFVDLAALQALSRDENGSITGTQTSRDASHVAGSDLAMPTGLGSRRAKGLVPTPIKLEDDLSPNDRPIFIGLSIPSAKFAEHNGNSQTSPVHYNTLDVPETPSIVITPAQNPNSWDPLGSSPSGPRAVSSAYSQATNLLGGQMSYTTSQPTVPASGVHKSIRDSTGTIFDEDLTPATPTAAKYRITSSCTVFEEDSTPILSKIKQGSPTDIKHTSISPLEKRASNGWWNFITTPFLTRSNTLASPSSARFESPPALPSLETANKAGNTKTMRDWEKSAFSPLTPETTTTISSDTWWDRRNTINGMSKDELTSPNEYQTYDSQSGTLQFMLGPSQTVLDRSRNITNQEPMPSTAHLDIQRETSTRSILSPSDREAPVMLDVGSLGISNVQVQNNSLVNTTNAGHIEHSSRPPAPNVLVEERGRIAAVLGAESTGPPPYSPPRQVQIPKYRVVLPPGHGTNTNTNYQEPLSPGPISPGLQRAIGTRDDNQMSEVPLTPVVRRPINLNSGYTRSPQPATNAVFAPPPTKALKAEKKRQRYENEDHVARKAGGLWRGRGCIPERGCYGRSGAEGRKRRRCWFWLVAAFLSVIILIVVLATQLHHRSPTPQPTQWLNLTGFPPIFAGISTVSGPDNSEGVNACAFPATLWSCALPKELQQGGSNPTSPNFRLQVQWDNSTAANETFANITETKIVSSRAMGGNAVSAGAFVRRMINMIRRAQTFTPSPAPPSIAEQDFLGNSTDGIVSLQKAGEATPFYVSFLSTTSGPNATPLVLRRDTNTTLFPNLTALIPPPSLNADGTAAPANLLPLPEQQPIRLYDRGLPTEHYGFYSYFDRSIFLKSTALLDSTNINASSPAAGEVPDDLNGGSSESSAKFRCTWAQTRFLVQMWTRRNGTAALLNAAAQQNLLASASNLTATTANDFTQPGSFPYPITITTDRHGGDVEKKMIYCYELDAREQVVPDSGKIWPEHRNAGGNGQVINPAPSILTTSGTSSSSNSEGFDGGNTGCSCQWQNWKSIIHA